MLPFDLGVFMKKSKKAKREGLEKHKQMLREKKMKRKERKKIALPKKRTKNK
jgi:hypothetical protein